jgi:hypothetical protein
MRPSPLERLTVQGVQLESLLEQVVAAGEPSAAVSGLQVSYDPKRPAGSRLRSVLLPSGRKVSRDAKYTIALTHTLLTSLNVPSDGKTAPSSEATSTSTFDALQGYLKLLRSPITPPDGPRIKPAS